MVQTRTVSSTSPAHIPSTPIQLPPEAGTRRRHSVSAEGPSGRLGQRFVERADSKNAKMVRHKAHTSAESSSTTKDLRERLSSLSGVSSASALEKLADKFFE